MCGVPGSGKSTFAKNELLKYGTVYVSRDEIRFELVKPNEEYFSKENLVFNTFVRKIIEGLQSGQDVIADATHLNSKSRSKLLFRLFSYLEDTEIVAVVMRTSLDTCLNQNELRRGTRAYVPRSQVRRMYSQFSEPDFKECNGLFDLIYIIEDGVYAKCYQKEGWF